METCVRTLEGHAISVNSVAISSADGSCRWAVSAAADKSVRLWDLQSGACVRTLEGHTREVQSVAISSADGGCRWAVSASHDTSVRLWDLQSGACVRTLDGHTSEVQSVTISSADGGCRWAVSASWDTSVRLWDLQSGACVRTLEGHTNWVRSVAISSADGGCRWTVSASDDKSVRLWDLQSGVCVRTLLGHTREVNSVAISSADGGCRWAVSASWDASVRLWDLQSGACVRTLEGHTWGVNSVAISSADGGCRWAVSASWDTSVRLWDLQSGACVHTLEGHTDRVNSVAISSADGGCRWAVSASADTRVQLWSVGTPSEAPAQPARRRFHARRPQRAPPVPPRALDGQAALEGLAERQRAADVTRAALGTEQAVIPRSMEECVRTLEGHTRAVSSVAISSADGGCRWAVSASHDTSVRLWSLAPPSEAPGAAAPPTSASKPHAPLVAPAPPCALGGQAALEALPERRRAADAAHPALGAEQAVIPRSKEKCVRTLEGHTSAVNSVAISSADGGCRWAISASWDNTLRLWDLQSGARVHTLEGHTNWVRSVAISSADGGCRWAISASADTSVRLWDLQSGACVRTLEGHTNWVNSVAISSADGGCRWAVSASWDTRVRLWDLQSGVCVHTLEGHTCWVNSVAISSADGGCRWAVSASNDTRVRLWDLQSGACVHTLDGHTNWVNSVAISSADGGCRWAVSASADKSVRLWDLQSGACVRTLEGHTNWVNSVAISSADGGCRWAVSASNDRSVRLWDLQSGACVHTLDGHTNWVNSVAISSADGGCRWAVSASADASVRLWSLAPPSEAPAAAAPPAPASFPHVPLAASAPPRALGGQAALETLAKRRRAADAARAALATEQAAIRAALGRGGVDEARLSRRDARRAELCAALEAHAACALDALADSQQRAAALRREARALRAALERAGTPEQPHPPAGDGTVPAPLPPSRALDRAMGAALHAHDTTAPPSGAGAGGAALAAAWAEVARQAIALAARGTYADADDGACASAWALAMPGLCDAARDALTGNGGGAGRLSDAARARADACDELAATAERARALAREAEAEAREIRALPPTERAHGAHELREREEACKAASRALRHARRALEDAHEDGGDVDGARRALVNAQRRAQRTQRARERSLDRLYELAGGPFPELPAMLPGVFDGAGALPAGARPAWLHGRTLAQYEPCEWPDGAAPGRARHEVLLRAFAGERVVLKVYPLASDTERRRLGREVEFALAHAHPNIARVAGVFVDEPRGARCALVQTPLYSGGTLHGWLERDEAAAGLPPEAVRGGAARARMLEPTHARVAPVRVRALRQLLAALAHLHARGAVHGDVKLENAFVQLPGDDAAERPLGAAEPFRVLLGDFDLARAEEARHAGGVPSATTRAGAGTEGHMAPELLQPGARASAASDVFAFGVCVLRALAADEPTRAALVGSVQGARAAAAALGEPLVVAALSDAPGARPSAAQLEGAALWAASDEALRAAEAEREAAAASARAALRTCAVCFDEEVPPDECAECAGGGHAVCSLCLSMHVQVCAQPDGGGGAALDADGRVPCVQAGNGCAHAYLDGELARRTTAAAFGAYWRAREQHAEARGEERAAQRARSDAERLAALGAAERLLEQRRAHIIEHILTLKCPRCGMAFAEWLDGARGFDGCCALRCARDRCGCHFCAYCLADCGADAHAHVLGCEHGNGTHFAQRGEFEAAQRARRERALRRYLAAEAGADGAARRAIVASVERELRDLRIDPDEALAHE